jgi:hypothetical protein
LCGIVLSGDTQGKMDQNLNISGRIILNFFNLDFTFFVGFQDTINQNVVLVENGIWVITKGVFIHLCPILARTPYSTTT